MSLINISNLTFAHEGNPENIFANVSFALDTDWKLGFIGRNGRGKTTFLKLLLGQYIYRGQINASVNFAYFPYAVRDEKQTALAVAAEIYPDYELWRLEKELSLLNLGAEILARNFDTLSGGEQTKILLAVLFLKENNFLLIDEPTNHLDLEAREIVAQYLNRKKGFILVSHDRYFLDSCVDHVLAINRANIEVRRGNFSSWQQNKEYQDNFELAENVKLKKDIGRLQESARRLSDWSDQTERGKYHIDKGSGAAYDKGFIGHKAAKMMRLAKNTERRQEKALAEKAQLLKNIDTAAELKLRPLTFHQNPLIEVRELSIRYADRPIFTKLNFTLSAGERIHLKGRNGCGKSSLLKLIYGAKINYRGELRIPPALKISYISQDTTQLRGGLKDYAKKYQLDEALFKAILRKLDFSREQFAKDLADFSGGQKKKVLLAHSLCESAHVYLWDEPLNFIDVLSRLQIENLLLQYQPTMIFVEHDKVFAEKVATRTLELNL
ncbi:lincosamide and streptogramin A transport system ATP-binding/permease protein [Candidatus Termititenax persephonae]|uniref:Lincosamide and streptogramin A transport system ATP-binding/permease protein n=1 Tax=Candidatus Termititenax persephonae TaxID=2218525 RepID=A0A388TIF3_9BACT|nr:lincosamide and streptogramin A transport system ATP-binding/permease protein [Candidatus Termititenax persephonae]